MRLSRADVEDVFDQVGAHSSEEKAAQEWVDPDLTGTCDLGKERDDASAEFAEVAGKFIGPGQFLEFATAGKDVQTEF